MLVKEGEELEVINNKKEISQLSEETKESMIRFFMKTSVPRILNNIKKQEKVS